MKDRKVKYLDSNLPVKVRVKDLLKRMTLEEKVMQVCAILPDEILKDGKFSFKKAKKALGKGAGHIGTILRKFGPREGAQLANEIQKFAKDHTRLGIPVIIHDECLHGCMAKGSASFPQAIGLASTWDPELIERVAAAIGKETRVRGIHQALSPTINIARDVRCGRTEETYGEDPYLASRMAASFVRGIQSQKVVATPKHFSANFVGDGGRDSNAVHLSERLLREIYFPAFEACVKEAGALSIMTAYNSLDGVPCSCNRRLLTDILRKEWKFKGFVVSDYHSVVGIHNDHNIAKTKEDAAKRAIESGLDMELPLIDCFAGLARLVKRGELSEEIINKSVCRILSVKFRIGLFEDPYLKPEDAARICDCDEHRGLAYESAREAIVLFKNNKFLPLDKNIKSVAVIGPNAGEGRLGGYSSFGINVIAPLEGIKNKVSKGTRVYFAEGCKLKDDSKERFREAVEIAKKSDAVIMIMGNNSVSGEGSLEGERYDRCNLDLPGVQEDLIREISNVNPAAAVVLINGSAVTMTKWINNVQAIVEAWYPGEEGGNAIADVLFGDYNPCGKLPVTFPVTTGQLPLYYNPKPSGRVYDYVDLRGKQTVFPFGHGLSYTEFEYRNLKITKRKTKGKLEIRASVDVRNTGEYKGGEVVQLYIRDIYSSLSRPLKELKGFKRIMLDVNEAKRVEFILTGNELTFLDDRMRPILEPGRFEIMIGSSSEDIRIKKGLEINLTNRIHI